MFSLPMNAFTAAGFYFTAMMFALSAFLLWVYYFIRWSSDRISLAVWLISYAGVAILAGYLTADHPIAIAPVLGLNVLLLLLLRRQIPIISLFGLFFLVSIVMPSFYGIIWLIELIALTQRSIHLHALPSVFMWIGAGIFIVLIMANTAMWSWIILARYSKLYFRFPRLQNAWKEAELSPSTHPWVSIHVPCYAEPPEVVIETLNALAKLEYAHFEVLVIDNNTKDPNLWKPVEAHCQKLGPNFRFFHFDQLKGAKAGALNAALRLTAPKAEFISVIDADYVVVPDFLKTLIKFMDNPKLGFVQPCQDYRLWMGNPYLAACYFEYQTHFKLELPGQNEWDVNYTIGTMCIIRRRALEEAGGWAEWCLTEDSEVAVRIHALGYTGHYLPRTFGYGLIPDIFELYKQQRFRWSAGPVQQFQRHWRLYLPWSRSGLTAMQKMGEIFHSLSTFFSEALNLLINVPILVICLWFKSQGQFFVLPPIVIILLPIAIFQNIIGNWIHMKLLGGKGKDAFLYSLAARSLVYIRNVAFYQAWCCKNLSWKRTDKFKMASSYLRAFRSCTGEIIMGLIYMGIAIILTFFASFRHPDIIFLIWLGIVNQMLSFFCAPVMALFSERGLKEF